MSISQTSSVPAFHGQSVLTLAGATGQPHCMDCTHAQLAARIGGWHVITLFSASGTGRRVSLLPSLISFAEEDRGRRGRMVAGTLTNRRLPAGGDIDCWWKDRQGDVCLICDGHIANTGRGTSSGVTGETTSGTASETSSGVTGETSSGTAGETCGAAGETTSGAATS